MNTAEQIMTTAQVAARFHELAQQEKWFDIQDELFGENVQSIEPDGSPYMSNAEGKIAVRKKADAFVSKVEAFHSGKTSAPIVSGKHFAVSRFKDLTVQGFGRIQINEIMLYEVENGKIISEQFFY